MQITLTAYTTLEAQGTQQLIDMLGYVAYRRTQLARSCQLLVQEQQLEREGFSLIPTRLARLEAGQDAYHQVWLHLIEMLRQRHPDVPVDAELGGVWHTLSRLSELGLGDGAARLTDLHGVDSLFEIDAEALNRMEVQHVDVAWRLLLDVVADGNRITEQLKAPADSLHERELMQRLEVYLGQLERALNCHLLTARLQYKSPVKRGTVERWELAVKRLNLSGLRPHMY